VIRFNCPRCDGALKVPDDRAGETVRCPKCGHPATIPESLDDEPPAAEHDTLRLRKAPLWAWGVAAFALLALAVGGVVVVRSGPKDGLTRAERAELEAKMKRDLPGTWEEAFMGWKRVYTFTDDGRFEVVRYELDAARVEGGKKVGGHVGTWSVSGSRMTLQVTESADDDVRTSKPFEMVIGDVKSEDGKVFKFRLSRSDAMTNTVISP
jgi:hypothetical protein